MDLSIFIPIAVALIAASPGFFVFVRDIKKSRAEKRKVEADAAATIIEAAEGAVRLNRDRLDSLESRVKMLEEEVLDLYNILRIGKEYTDLLQTLLKEKGEVPPIPEELLEKNWPKSRT